MSETVSSPPQVNPACTVKLSSRFCLREKLVEWLFRPITHGRLTVILPNGIHLFFNGPEPGVQATLHVHRWRMLLKTVRSGDLGFADSYIAGDWTSPDLTSLIQLMAANSAALSRRIHGIDAFRALPNWRHWLRRNSKRNSRKNIEAHYDLGNNFYRRWLDARMIYSSAIYGEGDTLETAQARKLARIVALCGAAPGDSVLEIGCGWGGLAAELAADGATVTGITLSPSQLAHAQAVADRLPAERRPALLLRDYRDIDARFDRIVSVEMIEAVGEEFMGEYFATIARNLKPGGRAVIQAITIADDRFDVYRADADFIQTYIFPGGFLPSTEFMAARAAEGKLRFVHQETFGLSYARTLEEWQRRFNRAWPEIERLGFDADFRNIWNYYLSYCAAGFRAGLINVGLYVLEHEQSGDAR